MKAKPLTNFEMIAGNLLILILFALVIMCAGCETNRPSNEAVESMAAIATTLVLNTQVKDDDRLEIAHQVHAIATGVRALASGTTPTPGAVQEAVLAFGGDKTRWAFLAKSIKLMYEAEFKKINNGDAKVALEILTAIAAGCDDAAVMIEENKQ